MPASALKPLVLATAFQCKAGDAMVRADDKRVVIW
jgi:predicted metalloendopeptidase